MSTIPSPAEAGTSAARREPAPLVTDPRKLGAETAEQLITAQADAGMTADRLTEHHHDLSARLLSDAVTPAARAYASAYADTADTLLADLRDLERRPEPGREPGTAHPDPFLRDRGWKVGDHGIYERGREAASAPERELEAG